MINIYEHFVPKAVKIAVPLNNLPKRGAKFEWGDQQQKAFETLKEIIMSLLLLQMPNCSKQFLMQMDASLVEFVSVFSQVVDSASQPEAFLSRILIQNEMKSSVNEFTLHEFTCFLEHTEFLLETDNQAGTFLEQPLPCSSLTAR